MAFTQRVSKDEALWARWAREGNAHMKSFELQVGYDWNNGRTEEFTLGSCLGVSVRLRLVTVTSASICLSKQYLQTQTTHSQSTTESRGAWMSSTCTTWSVCTGTFLTHVWAFMTLRASFYRFIMMWTRNIQMSPENTPKYLFIVAR